MMTFTPIKLTPALLLLGLLCTHMGWSTETVTAIPVINTHDSQTVTDGIQPTTGSGTTTTSTTQNIPWGY